MSEQKLLEATKAAYAFLAPISNQWAGRHTREGQYLLCMLRDAIAEVTGQDEMDVQDAAQAPEIDEYQNGVQAAAGGITQTALEY